MRAFIQTVIALSAVTLFSQAAAQLLDQGADGAVRVTIAQNQDNSRTTYRYDNANHRALATTRGEDGKVLSTIRYELDELGRFSAGQVFDGKNQLQFKTLYKYDANGRLGEEAQFNIDGKMRSKIVYSYNEAGKQSGYTVFDADGNQIGHNTTSGLAAPASIPQKPKRK